MNYIKLLVVEDRSNHMADFTEMLAAEKGNVPYEIEVLYAADLKTALELLLVADIVMTDLFFPDVTGGEEKPNGRIIVEHCLATKKPVVWITSTYHHGSQTEGHNNWGKDRGITMFDSDDATSNREGLHKPWKNALFGLFALVVGIELNVCFLENNQQTFMYSHEYPEHGTIGHELFQIPQKIQESDEQNETSFSQIIFEMKKRGFTAN